MGFLMETDYRTRKLRPRSVSHHPRDLLQGRGSTAPGYCSKVRALVNEGKGPAVEKRLAVKNRIEQRNLGTLDDLLDVNGPKQFQRNI